MEIKLKRIARKPGYTIGKLYADKQYVCDTLEDKDRGLTSNMSDAQICGMKVHGETAIPTGRYLIDMKTVSPRFGDRQQYKFCGGRLPRIMGVPGYSGVLIHCLTPDTEFLTENGWQDMESFKSNPASVCYSYNMANGLIEPVLINNFIEQDYHGKLFCNEGCRVNYSVTDKHRMYVGTKRRDGTFTWGIRTADDIPQGAKFIVAAQHEGMEITSHQNILFRLLMATQADGYILNWSSKSSQVKFHFTKERKIRRVCELVEQLGCSYRIFTDKEGKTHISRRETLSGNSRVYESLSLPFQLQRITMESSQLEKRGLERPSYGVSVL